MANIKITNQRNYDHTAKAGERNSGEIRTIPGQSYSVQELLTRHKQGLSPTVYKEPIYNESEEPDITQDPDFDMVDAYRILDDIKEDQKQKAEAKQKAEIDAKKTKQQQIKADEAQQKEYIEKLAKRQIQADKKSHETKVNAKEEDLV